MTELNKKQIQPGLKCPLLYLAHPKAIIEDEYNDCIGDNCAWYERERGLCAIVAIAKSKENE